MGEDQPRDETPWEVSEYRYEPPFWLEALFSPWFAGGVPVAALIGVLLWQWLG